MWINVEVALVESRLLCLDPEREGRKIESKDTRRKVGGEGRRLSGRTEVFRSIVWVEGVRGRDGLYWTLSVRT